MYNCAEELVDPLFSEFQVFQDKKKIRLSDFFREYRLLPTEGLYFFFHLPVYALNVFTNLRPNFLTVKSSDIA